MNRKNRVMTGALVGVAALSLAACATDAEPGADASDDAMEATAEATDDSMESTTDAMEDDGATDDTMESKSDDAMESDEGSSDSMAADVPEELQFSTVTLDGEAFEGESLYGEDSILWAWAAWCPTCQAEAPKVAAAVDQLPDGVTLYGLPGQADIESSNAFVDTYGVGGFEHIFDEDGSLWANFGVAYQPAFVMIDDDGSTTTIGGSLDTDGIIEAAEELATS